MSDQTYTPEDVETLRRTMKILRSTGPSESVIRAMDDLERELEESAARRRAHKHRPPKKSTRKEAV